jgi:ERCC4-related helicase
VVYVRQRRYLVDEVVPPPRAGEHHVVRMSCIDDDAQGQPLEVIWERETDGRILPPESWQHLAERGFDSPERFAAYFNTLQWNCVTSTDAKLLQAPFRAGIQIDPYQLEPLRKALQLPRVNLFIADDVGLGKTIEAGLIAREMLLRKKAREIVVACPPSMLLQWQEELDARFGLSFQILDKDYVQKMRRQRGFSVNPWATHSRFLISHRLLIDEAYVAPMRDLLGSFRAGTLFIFDEAHHAAPASGRRGYSFDTAITRQIRDLSRRFEHRLFLSATPHNGHSNSFSALLEILDPQRFIRGVKPSKPNLEAVMVRRIKEDLREIQGGFPKRVVEPVHLAVTDCPELRLAELLDAYRSKRETRLSTETKRVQTAAGLLISGLQQRLFSSVEAFAQTLQVHCRTVERQWEAARTSAVPVVQLTPDPEDDGATASEDEQRLETKGMIEAATLATAGPRTEGFAAERALLAEMTQLADSARVLADARVTYLLDWIGENLCPGGSWNARRVLIFTEFDDTRRYLQQQIQGRFDEEGRRVAIFHGPTAAADREVIKRNFTSHPSEHPLRILIATDAAREGLNLQAHCHHLFHFDIPWNPSRMEQRNGRIDRKLQPAPEVFCFYFVYDHRPEDAILAALVRKTKTIREELGSLSKVIDSRMEDSMKFGIKRNDIARLRQEIEGADLAAEQREAVAEELESARERQQELRGQIDRLRVILDTSKKHAGFSQEHLRTTLSCALELLGVKRLEGAGPERYLIPALDQRVEADPSWAETMDALRAPRGKDQPIWEWRRQAPLRPVVFEDPGEVTDRVVQLHLEHRLVRRLLNRFTSQGFVYNDLSRACLAQSKDAIPRVLLLGRLSLYGPNAARLHEEIVPIAARWVDPAIRKGPLTPYAREAETMSWGLLERSLVDPRGERISAVIGAQLQAAAVRDVEELLPHLETRAAEYAEEARKKLEQRGVAEGKTMREILERQLQHLMKEAARYDSTLQMKLTGWDDAEQRQRKDERTHWSRRLDELPKELETEPARIQGNYAVKASRVEPVGLVYLWPVGN